MIAELSDRFLRAASLVVTDRRWAATLSATALGFGLFVGVAIGPGAAGTVASGTQQIVMPSPSGDTSEGEEGEGGGAASSLAGPVGGEGDGEAFPSEPLPPASEPFIPIESEPPPPVEEPAPAKVPAPTAEEPAGVEATELKGTVVHANPAAGSYALAIKGGELVPVHAAKLPQAGAKLTVEGLQLANGTFSEQEKPKASGKAAQAALRGVVTFVKPDPLAPAYTVSGRGASLLVQVYPDPAGVVPLLPVLGARVTVDATIEPKGMLRQQKLEIEAGEPSAYLDLSGIYNGIHPETGQLLLSADDTGASEADLALAVSGGIEPAKLRKGDSYLATAEIAEDGSLALMGIASDEKLKGADDPKAAQGDLKR
jgi:hypothetical protein